MTRAAVATGWWNYEFTTDLPCARGCPPGAHPLYIGMSSRPGLRYEQHEDAPWRPYATGFVVHPEVYATEADALAAEERRIRTQLPYANRQHNERNPCRLNFGPAARRPRRTVTFPRRRPPARRRWSRPARRAAWLGGVWLALAVAIFVAVPMRVPFGTAVESSTLGASLLVAAPLLRRRRRRRRRW